MSTQKIVSLPVRIIVSFLANMVLLGVVAAVFGDPVQAKYFPELAAENPNMALLSSGALLSGILIAVVYPYLRIKVGKGWFGSALSVAVLLGLTIYFATHIVQAGYINVSVTGWLLEGLFDSTAPMASILALAWLTNRQNKA